MILNALNPAKAKERARLHSLLQAARFQVALCRPTPASSRPPARNSAMLKPPMPWRGATSIATRPVRICVAWTPPSAPTFFCRARAFGVNACAGTALPRSRYEHLSLCSIS